MPNAPRKLRRLFAAGAVLAVLIAAAFYLRGLMKGWHQVSSVPKKIPDNVAQSARGFTFSKSEGQRMLFTIQAANFQQYKDGQSYELHDASITLYGRQGDRSDHIYGSDFAYDQSTGNVTAKGEVNIDLEASSPTGKRPGGTPAVPAGNVVHLKTAGLTFNDNTGLAETSERIEFRIAEAEGSATGAVYNSRDSVLRLKSNVKVVTTGRQKATITGLRAAIVKNPQRVILEGARIEQPPQVVTTDRLTVLFRDDNSVERIEGAGNVRAFREGPKGFDLGAPEGQLSLDGNSELRSGELTGGVDFLSKDPDHPAQGRAGRVLLAFGAKGTLEKVRAEDSLDFTQGSAAKSQQVEASVAEFYLKGGKILEKAVTSAGPARIVLMQGNTRSTISADQFDAKFADNRLTSLVGTPNAKIVSSTPNQADRVSTSREVEARFNAKGEVSSAEQNGSFHYVEAQREAWAEHARYNPGEEYYLLTGSPRVADPGRALSAATIQLNRRNSSAVAEGNVKTTYNQLAQPGGAMLASAEPVHVTGTTMTAARGNGVARFTAARLWRGPDIVDAPVIVFDQTHRAIQAESDPTARVKSTFVQTEKSGKTTPVNIASDKLTYVDAERRAVFAGNAVVKIENSTMTADTVDAFLQQRGGPDQQGGSQLDRIVAQGDIQIEQPERKATGSRLVYTARDEKFVLTGSASRPPSIFDAERGQIQGDSLTFFTHDGRLLIGHGESSQPVTETKVQDANKK
jgi:lipopolysaccharide export system protein LptA